MLRRTILGVVICLSSAAVSFAQEFERPGPEHAHMKEFVGKWDAVMEMGGQKSKATAEYRSICGGMWLESDFEGDLGGIKFQGHGVDGYSQKKKKYVGVWVDSMSSQPLHFEGDMDLKTKMMVMTGEALGPEGKLEKFKSTTEFKDKDHFTFKMYMVDSSGKEQPAFTIEYARQK